MKKLCKLPRWSREIVNKASSYAKDKGFKAYLVGGVVRDLILRRAIFDLDIVIEGDAIELAQLLANHYKIKFRKHHAFGTATLYFQEHRIDFAAARKERYSRWGILPKVAPAGLEEDLFRRDFTVNSMAVSLNKPDRGRLIDLYGGLADLKNSLIRILHCDSFLDDPTRILRAIRFEQRFSFRMEKNTLALMKQAVMLNALSFVHLHRLKDELILILKEPNPYPYIKRINELSGFSFIDRKIKLRKDDFRLLLRIEKAVFFYREKFSQRRSLDVWLIYFAALAVKIPPQKLSKFLDSLGLKRGERRIIISIKNNLLIMKKLERKSLPHKIFSLLNPLSFEAIIFFYAYYTQRKIRENIKFFLGRLVNYRLIIKGRELKKIGLPPPHLYSVIMKRLLQAKMDKGLTTKKEELKEAKAILEKLRYRQPQAFKHLC